jgi:transcriptional regulator with XRE-family HTH domain
MLFGKKLQELRKQKSLSQEDLAIDLDISQSSISNYEAGITYPDIMILEKVSKYFNVPVQELMPDEHLSIYNHQNSGGHNGYYNYFVNNLPEKLIEQYEETIKSLKEQIEALKLLLNK